MVSQVLCTSATLNKRSFTIFYFCILHVLKLSRKQAGFFSVPSEAASPFLLTVKTLLAHASFVKRQTGKDIHGGGIVDGP